MSTPQKSAPADTRLPTAIAEAAAAWVARRDAGLSPEEARELTAWLAIDPRHREEFARFASAWNKLDRPLRLGAADDVLCELQGRAQHRAHRRRALVASAAAIAVLISIGFGWRSLRPTSSPELTNSARAVVVLPSLRSLPDGSIVELSEGAEISVDFTATSPGPRRVALRRGEAHFQVAKNPARPFVVVASGVEIRAVGTAFAVQLGTQVVDVLVTEGRVAVEVAKDTKKGTVPTTSPEPLTFVTAGHGVTVPDPATAGPNVRPIPIASTQIAQLLAWRSPRLEFSGTPLIEAVALLNRHNRLQFTIEDPSIARVRVSGTFGATNTDAFMRLLKLSFGVEAEPRGENELVLKRAR